ncbi:hypothetical protein AB8U03_15440 [Clostridium sp. Mt-5]|uniref:Uncharacterized protein n=1 Tax=Clostridium moutaii TaxID=3240932 RepID=A0ABV4BS07_9CLOT
MLDRKNGKLAFNCLDAQIFLGDMFAKCKNEHEVEWVQEQLKDCVEGIAEERLEELEGE